MHILLVSSAIVGFPCARALQQLSGVTLHEALSLEGLPRAQAKADLVFFDAALGEEEITQQIQRYQQKHKAIKWLVINVANIQQSLQYLQLGASSILTQPSEKTLQDCLQSISDEQLYLEADLIQILALRQIKKTLLPFKLLTAREFDVFAMLAEGYSVKSIAGLLSITPKTAFNCQTEVRKKLAIKGQQEIVTVAKKHGLIH